MVTYEVYSAERGLCSIPRLVKTVSRGFRFEFWNDIAFLAHPSIQRHISRWESEGRSN